MCPASLFHTRETFDALIASRIFPARRWIWYCMESFRLQESTKYRQGKTLLCLNRDWLFLEMGHFLDKVPSSFFFGMLEKYFLKTGNILFWAKGILSKHLVWIGHTLVFHSKIKSRIFRLVIFLVAKPRRARHNARNWPLKCEPLVLLTYWR